ncbi:hypothetical protein [Vibrio mediterranei]|uniref:hypothetical protein n=1 Tax=Vibrio mediterranei TaxID=689 RepID=UPI00406776BC
MTKITTAQKQQYLDKDGAANLCPVCQSAEIEGKSVDIEGKTAVQQCFCHDCEATWEDTYQLSGVRVFAQEKAVN